MVGSQLRLSEQDGLAPIIRKVTGPYVMAECFQSLWTASFRPKYNQGYFKYISALNLTGIAISLSLCHDAFTSASDTISNKDYWMNFLPLTLHFGWATAASLVNLNGMYALDDDVSAKSVAWMGHVSVVAATILGVTTTVLRRAPIYGSVIAWALSAVASGLGQRIEETRKEDPKTVGVYGAQLQQTLSLAGAALCAATSGKVAGKDEHRFIHQYRGGLKRASNRRHGWT